MFPKCRSMHLNDALCAHTPTPAAAAAAAVVTASNNNICCRLEAASAAGSKQVIMAWITMNKNSFPKQLH